MGLIYVLSPLTALRCDAVSGVNEVEITTCTHWIYCDPVTLICVYLCVQTITCWITWLLT